MLIDTLLVEKEYLILIDSLNQSISKSHIKQINSINQLTENINSVNSKEIIFLLIGALLGGIISWITSVIIKKSREKRKLKSYNDLYYKYEGNYLVYDKYNDSIIYQMLRLKYKNNTLIIDNGFAINSNNEFTGMISMNENNELYGTGYYKHSPNEKGGIGFGFLEVQLADDMILVNSQYFSNGRFMPYAYIWKKHEEIDLNKFKDKFQVIRLEQRKLQKENKK